MYESPRMRRLRNDLAALERLQSESSVFHFSSQGEPPNQYRITFRGKGLWRDHGKVKVIDKHYVEVKLGSSYPRTIPEIRWLTPIYHPNISEIGMVCLGGYGTHWVPSVQLDELCIMLWDMVRYHNYDIRSPYNRDAALWVSQQTVIRFPTDARPLRDVRAALGRVAPAPTPGQDIESSSRSGVRSGRSGDATGDRTPAARVRKFVQRYGRAFGMAPDEPAARRPESAEGARALPANSELQDLVAAQAAASPPPAVDGGEPVFILDGEDAAARPPAREGPAPSSASDSTGRPLFARPQPEPSRATAADVVDVAAEVRRLIAGREPARPPGDEILFIE